MKFTNKILITGGSGFIGSNFCRFMVNKYPNCLFINVDKLSYAGNKDNLKDIEKRKNYKFFKLDICNYKDFEKIIKSFSPNIIVNFAAETHVDRSILYPDEFVKTDIIGVHNILDLSRKYKVSKVVHISTDEVYGSIKKGSFSEEDALNPTSPYSASKASADLLIMAYYKTYRLPIMIVRPTNNYGPYQFPEKFIPLMITNALENKHLPVYGNGMNVRDWLYVEDTVVAIDIIIHKGEIGEIYNVSSKNEQKNIVVVKKILSLLKKPFSLIQFTKDRLAHDLRYSVNPTKVYKLGFVPKYNFETGLKITIDWYVNNILWWKKIKNSIQFKKFYNIQYKR